jgi:xanthine dehydrogenase/oxidase
MSLDFWVNGKRHILPVEDPSLSLPLVDYLRDKLNIRGTKKPCGVGGCGGCMCLAKGKDEGVAEEEGVKS